MAYICEYAMRCMVTGFVYTKLMANCGFCNKATSGNDYRIERKAIADMDLSKNNEKNVADIFSRSHRINLHAYMCATFDGRFFCIKTH